MIDFEKSRQEALDFVSLTVLTKKLTSTDIHRLSKIKKTDLKLSQYIEVWSVSIEICRDDVFQEINFYVGFPLEFPLVLPKVYLQYIEREKLKYIPHVDSDGLVCLYDDEDVIVNWKHPGQIVKECLIKAQKILEDGLSKANILDFEEEFTAYWDQKYSRHDEVRSELFMIENISLPEAGFLCLTTIHPNYQGYNIIIHNESNEFTNFKKYLNDAKYRLTEGRALFFGLLDSTLPFDETFASAYNSIKQNFPKLVGEFQRYVTKNDGPIVAIFARQIKSQYIFFGWQIGPLALKKSGFRTISLNAWNVFSVLDSHKSVLRLKFDTFTSTRLSRRTDGPSPLDMGKCIAMVGLGSIGSNLLPYLLSLQLKKLDLIDPDILAVENINRHLLGMNFIKRHKVNALEEYLKSGNPLLDVKGHVTSVIHLIKQEPSILTHADLVVVCVGKTNIEEFIVSSLSKLNATNAVAILWVEPYLIGAHCVYLRPQRKLNFGKLFENGIFKFNVVDPSEYSNSEKSLLFKEGGCQTSYLPYGQYGITRFLSTLIPELFDLLTDPVEKDLVFTFKGSDSVLNQSGLRLSIFGAQMSSNSIRKSILDEDINW